MRAKPVAGRPSPGFSDQPMGLSWARNAKSWLPWLFVPSILAYLVAWTLRLPRISEALHWISDVAFAPVLAEDIFSEGWGGLIRVGQAPHLSTIAFLTLTRNLPFFRHVWALAPPLIALLTAGLVGWACSRVAGRWAGILAFSLTFAASPEVLLSTLSQGMRSHTWLAGALFAAVLVWFSSRPEPPGLVPAASFALVCGAVGGITLASDPLFWASGLIPFAATAGAVWLTYPGKRSARLAAMAGVATVSAAISSALVWKAAYRAGFRKTYMDEGFTLASPSQMLQNLQTLATDLLLLGNGNIYDTRPGAGLAISLLMAAGVLGAAVVLILLIGRQMRKAGGREKNEAHAAYLMFWAFGAASVAGGFVVTTAPVGSGSLTTRYLVPVFYSLAALVPLWGSQLRRRQVLCSAGAALFCLLSLRAMSVFSAYEQIPPAQQSSRIIGFLGDQNARRGFASYWGSLPLTYHSRGAVKAAPVYECDAASGSLCPFFVNNRSAWYRPKPGIRSFLIIDPSVPSPLRRPPPNFGRPALERRFGNIRVLVYDFDIASRLSHRSPEGETSGGG